MGISKRRFHSTPPNAEVFSRTAVDDIDERRRTSPNPGVRRSLFLGFDVVAGGSEVLFADELRTNGLLVLGAMRCGKTALICSLLSQRIRSNDSVVAVLDFKGDDEAMHTCRLAAEEQRRAFLLHTNVPYFTSRIFNPLDQVSLAGLSRTSLGELITISTNLSHRPGYGSSHFSMQSLGGVSDAIIPLAEKSGWRRTKTRERVKSFVELRRSIVDVVKRRKELKHPEALLTLVTQLMDSPILNATSATPGVSQEALAGAIQVWNLFQRNEHGRLPVVYLYLRSESSVQVSAMIGKLFLNLLKNGLRKFSDFCKQGWIEGEPVEVDLIVDEAAYLLDDSCRNLIDQGASMGLRMIFANQTMEQYDDPRFAKSLFENVGSKLLFTLREPSWQDAVMKLSGEKAIHHLSYTIGGSNLASGKVTADASFDGLYGVRRDPGPRLERNHIIEISDTPNRAIFIPAQGAGVTQYAGYPIVIDTPFLHSKAKYNYIRSLPWCEHTPEMIVQADIQDDWDDYIQNERT